MDKVLDKLGISHGSVHYIIYEHLQWEKICRHNVACDTKKLLENLHWRNGNTPYSSDLAPSDFHVFGPMTVATSLW